MRNRIRVSVLVCVVALVATAAACVPNPGPPKVEAHSSVGQIWVQGQTPGAALQVIDAQGRVMPSVDPETNTVLTRTADANGSVIFRYLPPGDGYRVRRTDSNDMAPSDPVSVTSMDQHPDPSFYSAQHFQIGADNTSYGYLTTRDGFQLSYMVRLPGPPDQGPYPTVIEYSGYDPANPDSPQPSTQIAGILGYATVGVNIRGTGCSGGDYQFFENLQSTDGYDAVEAVAAQPWVLNHKVGMVGISYPGIAQLFTAQTQPPSLAAVAPLSVLDDSYKGTLYPGGILNNGFALSFVKDRVHDSQPAGQPWAKKRIDNGDLVCLANQKFRSQNPDMLGTVEKNPFFPVAQGLGVSLAPRTFVNKINVPVFLAGAWQDEQTGGHFANMLDQFSGTTKKHFTLVNGNHTESLMPQIISRWKEFLDFYVARKVPDLSVLRSIDPFITQMIMGTPGPVTQVPIPPDRFTGQDYPTALAHFEAEPPVRVLFDQGGAPGFEPGLPQAGFEASFNQWPIPTVSPALWYLGGGGALSASPPTAADGAPGTVDTYVSDPTVRPRNDLGGGNVWAQLPNWNWTPTVEGKSLSYVSDALQSDVVMAGTGSADLWLRSSAADTDLQVTLSEVRPDGKETYVQSGLLRASHRKLADAESTVLKPVHTDLAADAAALPTGQFTKVRVELFPFAHAFRSGSKLRISVQAPGGDRPVWEFATVPGTQTNDLARSVGLPSAVVLPVLPGVGVPTPLPACPGLRGQPCRTYTPPPPLP